MTTAAAGTGPAGGATGIGAIDRRLEALGNIPPGSMARRFGYMGLLTVGILMTAYASYLFQLIPPIGLKWFPDARLLFLLLSCLFIGVQAMGGSHKRRAMALYGVIGYVIAFHLEEATIHWIGPVPGSITGTRVGLVGTAGSLLALLSIVLMHIEVERCKLRVDVLQRGASPDKADALSNGLAAEGRRQALGFAAAVAGFGLFIFIAEKIVGDGATGGSWTLIVAGAGLLMAAIYLLRLMPGSPKRD